MSHRDSVVSVLFISLLFFICFSVSVYVENCRLRRFINPQTIIYGDSAYLFIKSEFESKVLKNSMTLRLDSVSSVENDSVKAFYDYSGVGSSKSSHYTPPRITIRLINGRYRNEIELP